MGFGKYLRTKDFWRQILWMLLVAGVLTAGALVALSIFTRHGKEIKVADVCGMKLEQLQPYTREFGFKFVVRDSVYHPEVEAGTILSQSPLPGSIVKKGRTFYLTVASTFPDSEHMPDLTDLSVRQASALLETYGLKLGRVTQVPQVVKGSVVRQLYNGRVIEPGSPVMRGSSIDIEVGDGHGVWQNPADTVGEPEFENKPESELQEMEYDYDDGQE